ncbi:MAG: Polyketide synthase PksL [Lentisphaerae bacterium ADurb.BinA184]|nr:MAG: Polyketide synthase PksL [Lentisphaerae bacterium ADurb.BinA184]
MSNPNDNALAIVGMSACFPGAHDLEAFWRGVVNGRRFLGPLPPERAGGAVPAAAVTGGFFTTPCRLHPRTPVLDDDGSHPHLALLRDLVVRALCDAGAESPARLAQTDLLIAGEHDGEADAGAVEAVRAGVAAPLGIGGAVRVFSLSEGAALAPLLRAAAQRLRAGAAGHVILAGVSGPALPAWWHRLRRDGVLCEQGFPEFLAEARPGVLPGEGGGAVVLAPYATVAAGGESVHALVTGVGDGSAESAVSGDGAGSGIRAALDAAGAGACPDYIEVAGGVSPGLDDRVLADLQDAYGGRTTEAATTAIGSLTPVVGWTLNAAGLAALIKTARALACRILPPTPGSAPPGEALCRSRFYTSRRARPWLKPPACGVRTAAVLACGPSGHVGGALLQAALDETTRPAAPGLERPTELLAFAADSRAALRTQLQAAQARLGSPAPAAEFAALAAEAPAAASAGGLAVRAAIVAAPGSACGLLDAALASLDADAPPVADVFLGWDATPAPPRLTAVFPGVGYPGLEGDLPEHLLTHAMLFPEVRRFLDGQEPRDHNPDDPLPTSLLLAPPETAPPGLAAGLRARFSLAAPADGGNLRFDNLPPDRRSLVPPTVLMADWVGWLLTRRLGVEPDSFLGQSIGDLPALGAAGHLDLPEVLADLWPVAAAEYHLSTLGTTAVFQGREAQLGTILDQHPAVCITLYISPVTFCLGGPAAAIDAFVADVRAAGAGVALRLPYPPMHSALMMPLRERLRALVARHVHPRPAAPAVVSSVTGRPFDVQEDALAETAADNLIRPARVWQTLRTVRDQGTRLFLHCGLGSFSTTAVDDVTPDRRGPTPDASPAPLGDAAPASRTAPTAPATFVALDLDGVHPLTQLQRAAAELFVNGCRVNLAGLLETAVPVAAPSRRSPEALIPLHRQPWPGDAAGTATASAAHGGRAAAREPSPPWMPFITHCLGRAPDGWVSFACPLRLADFPCFVDHAFALVHDYKPPAQCLATVPAAFALEMLAEAAAFLARGQGLTGFRRVRALKLLAFEDCDEIMLTLRVRPAETADGLTLVAGEIQRDGQSAFSAECLFGERYRLTVTPRFARPADDSPSPLRAPDIYTGGLLFHGPLLQSLCRMVTAGPETFRAELRSLPADGLFTRGSAPALLTDPVLLDGAWQAAGLHASAVPPRLALPMAMEAIEFYRPPPPPGRLLPVYGERTSFTPGKEMTYDLEIQDGDGHVWARGRGWTLAILSESAALVTSLREPTQMRLATPVHFAGQPEDVAACWLSAADDLASLGTAHVRSLFLSVRESAEMPPAKTTPVRRLQWLCGRLAVKNAMLDALRRRGEGRHLPHPVEITVFNEANGAPAVTLAASADAWHPPLAVSLAHSGHAAAAAVGPGPVGIDLEPLLRTPHFEPGQIATPVEMKLAETGSVEGAAPLLQLWVAKEAAAKAARVGLTVGAANWRLTAVQPDRSWIIADAAGGRRQTVRFAVHRDWLLALAT